MNDYMITKGRILLVDDEQLNVAIVTDWLASSGYEVLTAVNGEEGIRTAHDLRPDVILLDVVMPGMDGFTVCKKLKESDATRHIPVVMLTALTDRDSRHKGLDSGAIDFLNKPVDVLELSVRLRNVIELKEYHDQLKSYNERLENIVEEKTIELRKSFIDTIYRLTLMAEHKDKGTASHKKRVSHYTSLLAGLLGLSEKEADIIFIASPMHDIGKIALPDSILQNSGTLTVEEFEVMKQHTVMGGSVLCDSESEYLKSARRFALYHHENWDGTGYPYGLKGEDIPIEGRIMLIVDRYDAIRCKRPYKASFDHDTALKKIFGSNERSAPSHFDPLVLETFKTHHQQFAEIYEEHKDI